MTRTTRFMLRLAAVVVLLTLPAQASADTPLLSLYTSHITLQALDIHSTTRALRAGGREGNALVAPAAGSPVALSLVKAGGTAATIYLVEKLRKRNRAVALVTMVGLNATYAIVVAHNYRAGGRAPAIRY